MDQRSLSKTISGLSGLGMALLVNTSGFAIGVGEVQVKSALNQPLYASIPITATNNEGNYQDSLQVKLASPEMHEQAGLRYPAELALTRFDLYQAVNGRTQVLVGTSQPIAEPLVTFLLEVEWSHGRLLKEISMLLDPPGYQNLPVSEPAPATMMAKAKPVETPKAAPKQAARFQEANPYIETASLPPVADIGSFDVPVFVEVPASLKVAQLNTESYEYSRPIKQQRRRSYTITSGQYGPVRSGDTLMEIAKAAAKGTSKTAKQMAQDIYEYNPEAFRGSINLLEKGVMLYIPEEPGTVQSTEQITTTRSYADTGSISGISTISDFAFDMPSEIITTPTEINTAKEVSSSATAPVAERSLEILPPDETSTKIAQDIANKLEENKREEVENAATIAETTTDIEPVSGEVPATNASLKSAAGESLVETTKVITPDPSIKVEEEESGSATVVEPEPAVEKEQIGIAVETADVPKVAATDVNYLDTLLKWLPWILLMIALPIMLLMGLRRKKEPVTKIPPPVPAGLDAEPPQRNVEQPMTDEIHLPAFRNPEESSEFNNDTAVLEKPETIIDFSTPEPSYESDDPFHSDDLQPTATDTQETIRPSSEADPATQVMEGFDAPVDELESELDAAQEAEIYLAYGQYSLAESAINRLRDSNEENPRYKLLQLKLFAETGNLDEMHALSENLLEGSEADSGLAQQIHKITERAHSRHGTNDEIEAAPEETSVELSTDDSQSNIVVPLDLPENSTAKTTQLASTAFVEDIGDYLHEKPTPEEPSLHSIIDNEDPLGDSLTSIQPGDSDAEEALSQVENEAFTDAELDAISMELDLMDEPGDVFEIGDEMSESYSDDAVENFSDTDYRLSPLGRDDTARGKSERLEVPFDLESELEKLSQENKPTK